MWDVTNMSWPEAPFGANQRPFGRSSHMIAGFALDWEDGAGSGLVGVATAYLRFRPAKQLTISSGTVPLGLRATYIERHSESDELLALLDRALVRARRHAAVLAGDDLGQDLDRVAASGSNTGPGVATVRGAWQDRDVKPRGLAKMVDTQADLDHPAPLRIAANTTTSHRRLLVPCVAVILTAGWHLGHLQWDGMFPVERIVQREMWDQIECTGGVW